MGLVLGTPHKIALHCLERSKRERTRGQGSCERFVMTRMAVPDNLEHSAGNFSNSCGNTRLFYALNLPHQDFSRQPKLGSLSISNELVLGRSSNCIFPTATESHFWPTSHLWSQRFIFHNHLPHPQESIDLNLCKMW